MNPTDLPDLSKPKCSRSNRRKTKIYRPKFRKQKKQKKRFQSRRSSNSVNITDFRHSKPSFQPRHSTNSIEKQRFRSRRPHFLSFSPILELLEGISDIEGSQGTFIFKNERFALTGARFSKPVRARTGSELLRERMLSRGIEKRAATDSEQMRQ